MKLQRVAARAPALPVMLSRARGGHGGGAKNHASYRANHDVGRFAGHQKRKRGHGQEKTTNDNVSRHPATVLDCIFPLTMRTGQHSRNGREGNKSAKRFLAMRAFHIGYIR
jgi:hypothetical protein